MKRYFSILLFLSGVTMTNAEIKPDELIAVYNNFIKAASTGKETELVKYVTPRYLNTYKNNLASIGKKLDSEFIKNLSDQDDISHAKVVKVIENGPTAGIIFDMPNPDNKDYFEFLIMKFIKTDTWKYDQAGSISEKRVDDNGKPVHFQDSFIPQRIAIDGKIPETPALVEPVEIAAGYFIMGEGYSVELSANGKKSVISEAGSSSGVLPGGLKKGKNEVSVKITKIQAKLDMYPEVRIYYEKNGQEADAFTLDKSTKKTGELKFTFNVE